MSENKKIIFVYNADSGVVNVVKDFWKKILRPSSYECNLCMQTFSTFGMKKGWKNFIQNLDIKLQLFGMCGALIASLSTAFLIHYWGIKH